MKTLDELLMDCEKAWDDYLSLLRYYRWVTDAHSRKGLRLLYAKLMAKQLPRDYAMTHPGEIPAAKALCQTLPTLKQRWQSLRNQYQALQMLDMI